jgi:cytochrome c5
MTVHQAARPRTISCYCDLPTVFEENSHDVNIQKVTEVRRQLRCVHFDGNWHDVLYDRSRFSATGDFSAGAKQWANNCSRCHNMRDPRDLRDDPWITTAFHMRIRASLTGEETRNILTFLQESNSVTKSPTGSSASLIAPETTTARSGADVYAETCIACHGANGKGVLPEVPSFAGAGGPLSKPDAILHKHVLEGFRTPRSPMAMPPKGGNAGLSDADVDSVLQFLRDSFGPR